MDRFSDHLLRGATLDEALRSFVELDKSVGLVVVIEVIVVGSFGPESSEDVAEPKSLIRVVE